MLWKEASRQSDLQTDFFQLSDTTLVICDKSIKTLNRVIPHFIEAISKLRPGGNEGHNTYENKVVSDIIIVT